MKHLNPKCTCDIDHWRIAPDHSHVICLNCLAEEMENEDAIEVDRITRALLPGVTVPPLL